jgi:four helix bundle protein
LEEPLKDFRNLKVWDRSHHLTLDVYRVSAGFPESEQNGITASLRQACISISTVIAEACGQDGSSDLPRAYKKASGAASEVEYHLLLARDLGYLNAETYEALNQEVVEIKEMLISFAKSTPYGREQE